MSRNHLVEVEFQEPDSTSIRLACDDLFEIHGIDCRLVKEEAKIYIQIDRTKTTTTTTTKETFPSVYAVAIRKL